MILKCGACKENIEIQDSIVDGTHVRCPYCNKKTTYKASSYITLYGADSISTKLSHIELQAGFDGRHNATRRINTTEPSATLMEKSESCGRSTTPLPSSETVGVSQVMNGMESREIKERQERVFVISKQWNFVIGILLFALIVVGALAVYWRKTQYDPATMAGLGNDVPTVVLTEDSKCARLISEEDAERERKRKEAEAARARRKAEADAERERKRLEHEKELQEQKERAETEKANRERIEDVERKFKSALIVFATDFAADESPFKKDGAFYAIGLDYISGRKIYEAIVEHGVVVAVRAFSPSSEPTDVDVQVFTAGIMRDRLLVLGEDGIVWICGTGKSSWIENVAITDEIIMPAKIELGELFPILMGWGRLPDLKYRLTLKASKNGIPVKGGKEISLGIVEY